MSLCRASHTLAASLAPALTRTISCSAASQAPSAALVATTAGHVRELLGLSAPEAKSLVEAHPDLAATKPSVLLERLEFLTCGLGISPARAKSLVLQKPQLLGDLPLRELRTMTGLSE